MAVGEVPLDPPVGTVVAWKGFVEMNNQSTSYQLLSERDFLALGLDDVAYVRAVTSAQGVLYGIYAADGRQLAMMASRDLALAAVRQNDMEPLSLH